MSNKIGFLVPSMPAITIITAIVWTASVTPHGVAVKVQRARFWRLATAVRPILDGGTRGWHAWHSVDDATLLHSKRRHDTA